MDDLNYAIKTREYSHKISCYKTQLEEWGDNNTKGYTLLFQHYPEEFQAKLKNQEAWVAIDDVKCVVRLIILIKDLQYNKSDQKRLIMATVKATSTYTCVCRGTRRRTNTTRSLRPRWTRSTPTEAMLVCAPLFLRSTSNP